MQFKFESNLPCTCFHLLLFVEISACIALHLLSVTWVSRIRLHRSSNIVGATHAHYRWSHHSQVPKCYRSNSFNLLKLWINLHITANTIPQLPTFSGQ